MGIRFHCPNGHKLNVKSFQAGMRGICPYCGAKFTIPIVNTQPQSEPTDETVETVKTIDEPEENQPREDIQPPEVRSRPPEPRRAKKSDADPLGEDPGAVWYVRPPSGGQFGPADAEVMRTWLKEGRVTPDSLVWREGWQDWAEAVTVFPKLARVRWSPNDNDSTAKPTPPTPPNNLSGDLSKLGQKDTKKSAATKTSAAIATVAKKRSGGIRRLRSAREVKDRQVMIVVGLSALVVALACVLIWVLIRNM